MPPSALTALLRLTTSLLHWSASSDRWSSTSKPALRSARAIGAATPAPSSIASGPLVPLWKRPGPVRATLNGTMPAITGCPGSTDRNRAAFATPFWKLTIEVGRARIVASGRAAASVAADFTVTNTASTSASASGSETYRSSFAASFTRPPA